MQKRGQLLEQPFVYIFALILMVFILVFGFFAVKKFNVFSEDVQVATFIKDLENEVDRYYYYSLGSSNNISLRLPVKAKCVCILGEGTLDSSELEKCNDNLLKDFIEGNDEENIFLSPITAFKLSAYNIKNIKAIKNPICIRTEGYFKAQIETKKNYVEIK